jgi:hypothetical protein
MAERLDKALAMNEALADRVTHLEQEHADQSPVTSAGAPERRIGAEEDATRQTDRMHLRRLKVRTKPSTSAAGFRGDAIVAAVADLVLVVTIDPFSPSPIRLRAARPRSRVGGKHG